MITYQQPDFYKFGHDSLELVEFIAKRRASSDISFLEVGTGCGVMSIELALRFSDITIDALEPLREFHPFVSENVKSHAVTNVRLNPIGIEDYIPVESKKFDIIFFNPPYFWEEESRSSPDPLRDHCRRMKKQNFTSWLEKIDYLLNSEGKVFLTYRSKDVEVLIQRTGLWEIQEVSQTSGSCLLYMKKRL